MKSTFAKAWSLFALALGVLVLAGTALAGNGGGNGGNDNGGGPPATPPGQEKKQEATPPPAPAPAAAPAAASAPGQVKKAAAPKPEPKKAEPAKAAAAKVEAKKAAPKKASPRAKPKAASSAASKSSSSPAPKITICHRTGSDTNPYVEITISENGLNGHDRHGDIIPAPAGGCPAGTTNDADKVKEKDHDKVTICHATGSETNPYVVITISQEGWDNGHSKHEGDINPVPAGGCPTTAPASVAQQGVMHEVKSDQTSCPATETRTEQVLLGVWHKTGNSQAHEFVWITPNEASAHLDATKHEDDRPVYETRTIVVSTGQTCSTAAAVPPPAGTTVTVSSVAGQPTVMSSSAPLGSFPAPIVAEPVIIKDGIPPSGEGTAAQPSPGGVAGVTATLPQKKKERGGVLGTARTLGETAVRGRLPFTGLPLWAVAIAGAALLGTGLMLRRRGQLDRP